MKFRQATLSNGLTIIGEQRESAVSVALGFFVKTGARDETPSVSGVSHFLEHMLFKGTPRRNALEITYALSGIGAQANAFTSEENTVYYAAVLPEYLTELFDILADMMRPSLDPQEFATEKKVILEEIALYQDMPSRVLFEAALREHFGNHPGGNSVLGSTESISALAVEQMRGYFDAQYSASNIVLAASGKFDWDQLVGLAERYCGTWPNHSVQRLYPPFSGTQKQVSLQKEDLQCAHACILTPGPSAQDHERYASQLLSCVLGDSHGSRAYWDLIDKGLADTAYVDTDEMDRTGFIYAYASAAPERLEEVKEKLAQILSTPSDFRVEDLERAKTKIRTRLVLQGESSMRRLMAIGLEWIYRSDYTTVEEELRRYAAVTRDDIQTLLQRYSFAPMTVVELLPQ